jgi:pilus assembly protein CpaC
MSDSTVRRDKSVCGTASVPARVIGCAIIMLCASPAFADTSFANSHPTVGPNAVEVQNMDLQLGEQRVLPTENVRSYSEGTKGVIDVRLTKDAAQFIIVALNPGTTTLLFLMMDGSERHYHVTVVDPRHRRGESTGVEPADNIRLDFYFVQVSTSHRHQIGLGWPGAVAPTFGAVYNLKTGTLDSATAVIANQALPRLDMAQGYGWAKVMRQAAVVTANGHKATFSGGGEVNYPIQSALTTGLQKIPFGSIIEVEPTYDTKTGRIELRVHADISELDSDSGTGVPGRVTSNLDTAVNLELGQSIILAGLTARSERRSKSGIPVLSQIPILGVFFGSHARTEQEAENIVLIVPTVVDAITMQDRERVADALRSYSAFAGDLDEVDYMPPAPVKAPRQTSARGGQHE